MAGEPVRVLRVITRLNAGGPARHAVWLTAGLRERSYDTLLVTGQVAPGESDLSAFAAEHDIAPRVISGFSREIEPLSDARTLQTLRRIIREFDPHIVHTHMSKAGFLGRVAVCPENSRRPKGRRIRVVHTFHGNVLAGYFSPGRAWAFRTLERRLARATDAVLVLSPQQCDEIVGKFGVTRPEKVHIVPLGLDLSPFAALPPRGAFRREMGFPSDAFVVGTVGRIAPVKNHEMFVRAAALLQRKIPRARFVVVGDGEGAGALRTLGEASGLGDSIRFTGLRTDLPRLYADLDVVALTSRNEGTPLSLIEAMTCGRAVVSTDVGGVRDLLTREWNGPVGGRTFADSTVGRGLLVPSGDADRFAAALERLEADPALRERMGKAGRAYALRFHALPRLLDDMDAVYQRILSA